MPPGGMHPQGGVPPHGQFDQLHPDQVAAIQQQAQIHAQQQAQFHAQQQAHAQQAQFHAQQQFQAQQQAHAQQQAQLHAQQQQAAGQQVKGQTTDTCLCLRHKLVGAYSFTFVLLPFKHKQFARRLF